MRLVKTFLFALVLVPLINLLWTLAAIIYHQEAMLTALIARLGLALIVLSISGRALMLGRYPTTLEMQAVPWPERILSVALPWLLLAGVVTVVLEGGRYFLSRCSSGQRRSLALGGLAAMGVWLVTLSRPLPMVAEVRVDVTQSLGAMSNVYRGYSQGGEVEMQTPGYFELAATRLTPLKPHYVRIDHIYDYYGVYQVQDGKVVYDWTALDRVVDAILATGAQPFICLSYLPPAMAQDVYGPPPDWEAWGELVYQTVYHFNVERQLGIEYWEVWNEPNLFGFWHGTLDDYLRLYEVTAINAKRADPTIRVGGPATASLHKTMELGAYFHERNWVQALGVHSQRRNVPLDFVSWHYYDAAARNYAWSVAQHRGWLNEIGLTPELLITEWNWSAAAPVPELDTEVAAAHAAGVVTTLVDAPLKQAFFFEVIDSSTQPEGRWGMVHKTGQVKPVYWTLRWLNDLAGNRVGTRSNHPQVGVLASQTEDMMRILLWRYVDAGGATLATDVTITGLAAINLNAGQMYELATAPASYDAPYPRTALQSEWRDNDLIFRLELLPKDVRLIQFSLK